MKEKKMRLKRPVSMLFLLLTVLFTVCLIVSNLIAGKIFSIGGVVTLPAAVILFPVTYILGDVFTEVYGFKKARNVIWTGFAMNLFAVLIYLTAVALPAPAFFEDQEAYRTVLWATPRVLAASVTGYLAGEFSNAFVLSKLKVLTKGKRLWVRTILSTLIGEGLDSFLFIMIAFAGTMAWGPLFKMMLFQYLFKVAFEVIFTPLTYLVVKAVKKTEGTDVYDTNDQYRIV